MGRRRRRAIAVETLEGRIAPATFHVLNALDGPGDGPSGSLRHAIALADQSSDPVDTVVIAPSVRGAIALNFGALTIGTSLNLLNRSGGPIEIRQETPGARIFQIGSSPLAALVNIGAATSREVVTLTGGNASSGDGGAILAENPDGLLTLTHVRIVGNAAGLASASSESQNGGGIYAAGRVALNHSVVTANQTSGDGGGVWAGAGVVLTASTVDGNQAGSDGGGLYVAAGNAALARGSSVSGNHAPHGTAGGLFVASGDTSVSASRINENHARNVGGINAAKGNVRVVDASEVNRNASTATLNVSLGDFGGGGIAVGAGDVFVSHSQVSENQSVGMYSSGIVVGLGSVTVTAGSRINGNRNNGPGGGIAANFGGTVTVNGGSQVNHNTGSGLGGGIVNFAGRHGGVRILDGGQVNHNTVTNYESLGQAVAVFLEVLAGALGLDFTTATGGTSPAALAAEITRLEQEVASSAEGGGSLTDPPGFVVAGGGIGTLLGASITIAGGGQVIGNLAGAQVSGGNPNSIGVGGGLFAATGPTHVRHGAVIGNTALGGGGGGLWNGGSLTVVGSVIARNTAVRSTGGGLHNASGASATLRRGTIRDNRASSGGGAYNLGTLNLVKSQVVRNVATIRGGGITNRG
ncbi:MAG: hypothetical protein AB7I30_12415, partial [Isosphaeraceae bacterium]